MPTVTVPQAIELALQHHRAGRLAEAEAAYREVLAEEPDHPDIVAAWNNLGNLLKVSGRLAEAVEAYRRALASRPEMIEARHNLGVALAGMSRWDEAVVEYQRALELRPGSAPTSNHLGNALRKRNRGAEAIAAYRQALQAQPDYAEAWNNLGAALMEDGKLEEAEVACRRALALRPDFPQAHSNLGNLLRLRGQLDAAAAACERALELNPDLVEASSNLGVVRVEQDRVDEAVACYARALALDPGFADAHSNLGVARWLQGRYADAEGCYRRAIECRSDLADAHFNFALLLLLLGRFEEGWQEYEWRWRTAGYGSGTREFAQPRWDGQPAPGKTLLIHAEQGFGDTLLFLRYVSRVRARSQAARVILECQRELWPLLVQLRVVGIEVVARGGTDAALPACDLHVPLLSLPLLLEEFAPLPPWNSVLEADAALRARWREEFREGDGLRVGVVWAGNPGQREDRRRSMTPALLAPILNVPGARFYSLQVKADESVKAQAAELGMRELSKTPENFADTAAILAELDLVITVDTSTAHLAGTLGRPVWVMVPYVTYWSYGLMEESTPWYPGMRLFRQAGPSDWSGVVERVAEALRERCA